MLSLNPLIYILAFVAVIALVQGVASLLFSIRDRTQRVNRRLSMMDSGMSRDQILSALIVNRPGVAGKSWLGRFQAPIETYLRQAGVSITPAQLLAIIGALAGALWLVALSFASSGAGPGFLVNGAVSLVAALVLASLAAGLWIRRLRNIRIAKIAEQLPLALDVVNRAVRAGHPVISAVQLAANELSDPVGSEFGLIVDETTYGVEFKEALANFARRTGSSDAHFFSVSVSIQSETGGNLAEILEGLAAVMRGRHTLGKRVRSLASEGRASALLLTVLPVFVIGVQLLIKPTVYSDKFADPIFWPVVAITAAIYFGGWMLVHRIINFRY